MTTTSSELLRALCRARAARAIALASALAVASVSTPQLAFADSTAEDMASARNLFNKGRELRDQGDLKGAVEKFKAAHSMGNTPLTGYELGKTHMQLGEIVEAREAFLSVGRVPVAKDESAKSAAARTESQKLADDLRAKIPTLRVVFTGLAEGASASVTIDGSAIPAAALSEPRGVNPGKHIVAITVAGAAGDKKEEIEVKESETREVTIDVSSLKPGTATTTTTTATTETPPTPPPPKDSPKSGGISPLTFVGFGIGGVGLIVGGVTGILAMSKASQVKDQCINSRCPPAAQSDLDSTKTFATISTIGFIAGGIGITLGVIGLASGGSSSETKSAKRPTITPWIGLGSAGVSGAF